MFPGSANARAEERSDSLHMSQDNNYILEMRDIVKLFPGVKALDGVTLRVRPGSVHVIVGENGAGKSTLMKVINGEYVADEGEMIYKGQKVGRRTIQQSIEMGIAMIHQELSPILPMTVAENIFAGREPTKIRGVVDAHKMNADATAILEKMHLPYKATDSMRSLTVAGHQLVEIAKAVSRNAAIVIMDEPTSAIADSEVDMLFEQVAALKASGAGIIYITHKMDEIFRIADDITVIRDGQMVESGPAESFTIDRVIALMVGREVDDLYPENKADIGDVVLEVKNLTKRGKYRNVSFQLRRGEILGFSGLIGAGRSEVMRAIFGLEPADSGEIWLEGKKLDIRHSSDAIKAGIAMVTEDRRGEGIIPAASSQDNLTLAAIKTLTDVGFVLNAKKELDAAKRMIQAMSIRLASVDQPIRNLSGGNQQKVILGRWMLLPLKVLILDEPTRGIDVGSKQEVHQLMCDFAEKGYGVIMISSELPEIVGMSDRVVVMHEGNVNGELMRGEATQESIMELAVQ